MKRILATSKFIHLPPDIPEGLLVLTPNKESAARLKVPHRSLRSVAVEVLNRESIGIATPTRCRHVLKSVIAELNSGRDAAAEAVRIKEVLATVLRDGIDIAAL